MHTWLQFSYMSAYQHIYHRLFFLYLHVIFPITL